jgi:hypothetical protein
VTVTVTDDGEAQSCRYETSLQPNAHTDCSVTNDADAVAKSAGATSSDAKNSGGAAKDQYTRITFERRYTPGTTPDTAIRQTGETLLGGRVMALAINAKGAVENCKVVATSGSLAPEYSCDEAQAEKFEASATNAHAATQPREGFMTILVYGHAEHVV